MIAAQTLIDLFQQALDEHWGYIWGQHGAVWTEAKQRSAKRAMTVKYGSRWIGSRVTDCSGLFYWAFQEAGGSIYHGANRIWQRHCASKGTLRAGQAIRPGTAVFLNRSGNRHHIGLYVGSNTVIEARGTQYGVVTSPLDRWDEWGELSGVDYSASPAQTVIRTLRAGDTGDDVTCMQHLLTVFGFTLQTDGIFGAQTKAALLAFQQQHALTADGVCGPLTWAALQVSPVPSSDTEAPAVNDTSTAQPDRLTALEARLLRIEEYLVLEDDHE